MPRPLRLEFKDAWYHVMNHSTDNRKIFKTDQHRRIFLELLSNATHLFGIEVHAYCLMSSHYHLVIKTPRANLSRVMRQINGLYTQKFNSLEKTAGPLFKGRYKTLVIDPDKHLLQVSRFVHLNPVMTKTVKDAGKYKWSSYTHYLDPKNKPTWFHTDETLLRLNKRKKPELYKQFIQDGIDVETKHFYQRSNTPSIMGSGDFKEKLLKSLQSPKKETKISLTASLPSIDKISKSCAAHFKMKEDELYANKRGKTNDPRKIAIYAARMWGSEKLAAIAEWYQCGYSNISNIVTDIEGRIKEDRKFHLEMERFRKMVFKTVGK